MTSNFRSAEMVEPRVFGGAPGLHTPVGIVPQYSAAPALPPRPFGQQSQLGSYGAYNAGMGMYASGSMFGGGAGYGGMYGGSGYGGGMWGGSGYGGGYGGYGGGGYNRYGMNNGMDAESRFIQMAEESSRPAFQSIESLVSAIGNIAAMLDSTFFAITSSFRAILGVAANFGRLRGVFAQFWSTFAVFRGMNWLYQKILYLLKITNVDPSIVAMGEAFAAASGPTAGLPSNLPKSISAWPIFVFLGFIFTAPYLIMKMIGSVSSAAIEESRNPRTWVNPIQSRVIHTFQASNPCELTIRANQPIFVAPREVQNTHKLLNTGWLLASVDNISSGIIPVNYIESPVQKSPAWTTPTSIPETHQFEAQHINPKLVDSFPDNKPIVLEPEPQPQFAPKIADIPPILSDDPVRTTSA